MLTEIYCRARRPRHHGRLCAGMKPVASGFATSKEGPRREPAMKFLLLTLITHHPDPVSGEWKSPADRLREVVDSAALAEDLGFDGFAVGERHEDPFISSS